SQETGCRALLARGSLLENIRAGMAAVETDRALYMTSDVPLLRGEMIDEFVERALPVEADLCASIVERRCMGRFAGTRKPFIRLADGAYQHGNLFMIPRASLARERVWRPLNRIYRARKNGLATAAVLGPGL